MSNRMYFFFCAVMGYLIVSGFGLEVRSIAGDCRHRYIDYILPLTLLHCEVGAVGK